MPCNCGKPRGPTVHFMGNIGKDIPDPVIWGPIVWKYLHCLTEKIAHSGNPLVDNDQSNLMETLITNLNLIIPCQECQTHAHAYINANPLPSLKGLRGDELRNTIRNWLFNFHHQVRITKGQSIVINTSEACREQYNGCIVSKSDYNLFIQNVGMAVSMGWVKTENWRKWYTTSEKLRITIGNVVI